MHPGNRDFWDVVSLCATQWLTGFGGPYGLNYTAINIVAQALEISVDRSFLEKLRYFEGQALQLVGTRSAASRQKCDAEQKEKCAIEFGEHLEWSCKNCNG